MFCWHDMVNGKMPDVWIRMKWTERTIQVKCVKVCIPSYFYLKIYTFCKKYSTLFQIRVNNTLDISNEMICLWELVIECSLENGNENMKKMINVRNSVFICIFSFNIFHITKSYWISKVYIYMLKCVSFLLFRTWNSTWPFDHCSLHALK